MEISKLFGIFKRFPHFSESIFNNLDNQSLINCKEASRELSEFLESERFFWIRILRNYNKNYDKFQDHWKMSINKTSIEIVKHLAVATNSFFKSQNIHIYEIINNGSYIKCETRDLKQFTPIHVAVEVGNMELMEHVLKKLLEKIPSGSVMIIPPGNFMSDEVRSLISQHSMDEIHLTPYREQSTLLNLAARKGNFGVCRLMIGYVDDCNLKKFQVDYSVNHSDRKKLIVAVANSHVEIAKFLLTEKLKEKIIPRILEEHPFIWKP